MVGLKLGVAKRLSVVCVFVVCVFAFASTFGGTVAVAFGAPITQDGSPDDSNLTVSPLNSEPNSADISDAKPHPKEKRKAETLRIRRQNVLGFLKEHFPELRESLLESEKKSPRKSRNALKRLERDVILLRNIQQRQPSRFEPAVEQWKLKTQIEITVAKYAKKETDEQLKGRLTPLFEEMLVVRKALLKLDRQTTSDRLDRIDKLLINLESNGDRAVESRLRLFQKSIDKIRAKQKTKQKKPKAISSKDHPNSEETPQD